MSLASQYRALAFETIRNGADNVLLLVTDSREQPKFKLELDSGALRMTLADLIREDLDPFADALEQAGNVHTRWFRARVAMLDLPRRSGIAAASAMDPIFVARARGEIESWPAWKRDASTNTNAEELKVARIADRFPLALRDELRRIVGAELDEHPSCVDVWIYANQAEYNAREAAAKKKLDAENNPG